ncbi:hypothetical protein TWF281_008026 [Arthrobotrys megalospora]
MKFTLPFVFGLSFSVSVVAYQQEYNLQRRTCSKNNLYRTLERLQRESSFCVALLAPNPTVTVPSSISATPIATISSACNCIVATLTTSETTTTTTTTTTSLRTTSTISVCENTVTILPDPVTVTVRPDPVTVTETYTPTSPPTQAATAYTFDFEDASASRIWACSSKIDATGAFPDFAGCGDHEDSANAHSGNWFFRFSFYLTSQTRESYFRFGNIKGLSILPNTDYELSLWYRQFTPSKPVCTLTAYVDGDNGFPGYVKIGGPGVVQGGWAINTFYPTVGVTWTKTATRFNTKYNTIGLFVSANCICPAGEQCGVTILGIDDIVIKPVTST